MAATAQIPPYNLRTSPMLRDFSRKLGKPARQWNERSKIRHTVD
ncbi:hypothetical protein HMPREF0388_0625 [Mobiluncus curtisii ATCC 51333]|uniref:Uncharacterized protein n=1 Tax=Mobiluncus curtisii ATCC 51333 TaxID=887326 RepID=E6LXN8_9ACTO|nr:hypothetical protein HMPREF0388_0625 [Mobiluncus curtisii ATCC 51333]